MTKYFCPTRIVLLLAVVACTICVCSFRQKNTTVTNSFRTRTNQDTTAPGQRSGVADEFRMHELNNALKKLEAEMTRLDERMGTIDFEKVQKDLATSLGKISWQKTQQDVEAAIKSMDWNKMNAEIKQSFEKVKLADIERIQNALEHTTIELETNLPSMDKKFSEGIKKGMEKAKAALQRAKIALKNKQELVDALDNDGLINKKKPYKVKIKDNKLYLNGTMQPKRIRNKYRRFYYQENFSIIRGDEYEQEDDFI